MPRVLYKSWNYGTRLHWKGGRNGELHSADKPAMDVSSPPEFRGQPGAWTPEDLLTAAVESCVMTTFLSFAERAGVKVLSYESSAQAALEHDGANYRFTRIAVKPRIALADASQQEAARSALEETERNCFISNSLKAEVRVEAEFSSFPPDVA